MKKIEDYLHLYYGAELKFKRPDDKIYSIFKVGQEELGYRFSDMKLILRPLSDMTEEEGAEYTKKVTHGLSFMVGEHQAQSYAEATRYLLSNHFDLFGLIEAGLAIAQKNKYQ